MQSGVSVEDNEIFGTLNYVTEFNDFSEDTDKQEGNFLVLNVTSDDQDDTFTVELAGGEADDVVMVEDDGAFTGSVVVRVTEPRKQKLKVTVAHTNEDESVTTRKETYDLHQLELLPADDE